jgi:two-component system chemotaxis sensor kinase CheA
MDVVRSSISSIGGSVDVESIPGRGTKFRVKIPLTLAIIPALVIAQNQQRYAIPQVNLVELVRIEPSQVEGFVSAPVYRLRGRLLPLVYLSDVLEAPRSAEIAYVLVLAAGSTRFGLVVDDVHDTAEIVVKPLTSHLQGIEVFSGATVMGDGRVALILDAVGLAAHALHTEPEAFADTNATTVFSQTCEMLLASIGGDRRVAVALDDIDRLEVFALSDLEHSNGQDIVQYRNTTMPLCHIASRLGSSFAMSNDGVFTIVCGAERPIGIVVERILDVFSVEIDRIEDVPPGGPVRARVIAQGRITDVVDLQALIGGM